MLLFFFMLAPASLNAEETEEEGLHRGTYEETDTVSSCQLKALHTETVTFDAPGSYFEKLYVQDGEYVKAGQVLASFVTDYSASALEEARKTLQRAQENYAAETYNRQQAIAAMEESMNQMTNSYDRDIMQLKIYQAWASYNQYVNAQEYAIAQYTENLSEMEETYSTNTMVSPIDGIVQVGNAKRYSAGDPVSSLTMYVADPESVRIIVGRSDFRCGMEVTIQFGSGKNMDTFYGVVVASDSLLPAYDETLKGTIGDFTGDSPAVILVDMEPSGMTLGEIFIEANKPKSSLQYMTFSASVQKKYVEDCVLLPLRAATLEAGKYYVMVDENGSIRKQYLTIGLRSRDWIWVLSGIDENTVLSLKK